MAKRIWKKRRNSTLIRIDYGTKSLLGRMRGANKSYSDVIDQLISRHGRRRWG